MPRNIEKVNNEGIVSDKARYRYKRHRRNKRRAPNKFEDVTTMDAVTLPISSTGLSPQNQNGDPVSGQVRVSYDKHLPFIPQPYDTSLTAEQASIANGMHPILQTNTLVQPMPHGTKIRTQNHGGQGGPAMGNFTKMRPLSAYTVDGAASINTGMYRDGSGLNQLSDQNWNNSNQQPPVQKGSPPNPYKDVVYQGSTFPDKPVKNNRRVKPNKHIKERIVPILDALLVAGSITKGMYGLVMVHAIKEGYYPKSRAYRYNNPGNVGNTDSGANKGFESVRAGIQHLIDYIKKVAGGNHRRYTIGKEVYLKPYFSQEIANNPQYGLPAHLPGYRFTYTGQIDQYVKIYATGARAGNSYLSQIISYFNQEYNVELTPQSKIQDIIMIN